jgi:hypothetical protein
MENPQENQNEILFQETEGCPQTEQCNQKRSCRCRKWIIQSSSGDEEEQPDQTKSEEEKEKCKQMKKCWKQRMFKKMMEGKVCPYMMNCCYPIQQDCQMNCYPVQQDCCPMMKKKYCSMPMQQDCCPMIKKKYCYMPIQPDYCPMMKKKCCNPMHQDCCPMMKKKCCYPMQQNCCPMKKKKCDYPMQQNYCPMMMKKHCYPRQQNPPSSRWRNHPTFLSKEEIEDIFNLLQNHFHQTMNPVDLIQSLIKENQELLNKNKEIKIQLQNLKNENDKIKNKNQELQNENEETKNQLQNITKKNFKNEKEEIKSENIHLKEQNQELKTQNENLVQSVPQENEEIKKPDSKAVQVNLSGYSGIISTLKQNDPNPVLLTSSSNNNLYGSPENILNPDDKCWLSDYVQNSWICFNFKNKQISPSGYLIRNGKFYWDQSPQGWKFEGSNDQQDWETIHEVRYCQSFRKENQEASFSCQTNHFFSFLRFTQIQENVFKIHYPKDPPQHYFLLNFVEFSGKIISRN